MEHTTLWWLLTGAAVAVELATGTFYLLMIALGLAAAALSAHAGLSSTAQLVVAAAVGVGSVLALRRLRRARAPIAPASANPDVNLDIGATVDVSAWNADGTASVKYRGAQWLASCASPGPRSTGAHQIVEVIGSRLVLHKI